MLIDVHGHLYDPKILKNDEDFELYIQDLKKKGVGKVIVPTEDICSAEKALDLAKKYPNFIYPGLGLHPLSLTYHTQIKEMCDFIESHHKEIVCIGEVGLDFTPKILSGMLEVINQAKGENEVQCDEKQLKDLQREALLKFIEISKKYDLPLNIHSRSAGKQVIGMLKEHNPDRFSLLHCFDGSLKAVKEAIKNNNCYFSIPAAVVRSKEFEAMVDIIPLDRLLTETDSPYMIPFYPADWDKLSPEARRDYLDKQVNSPANVRLGVDAIARIKKLPVEEVETALEKNAKALFPRLYQ